MHLIRGNGPEEWATPATNTPRGSGDHSAARDSALGPPPAAGVFLDPQPQQVEGDNREAAWEGRAGGRALVL